MTDVRSLHSTGGSPRRTITGESAAKYGHGRNPMNAYKSDGERIYHLWDQYARRADIEGLLSLYAADATLESPLINAILDTDKGVIRGQAELRHFFTEGGRRLR